MKVRSRLAACLVLVALFVTGSRSTPGEQMPHYDADTRAVAAWLDEPPWYDPARKARQPKFAYDDWLVRGRRLPHLVPSLVTILNAQDAVAPTQDSMRAAYALGFVGDKSSAVSAALMRMLRNRWILTSITAAAALATQGDAQAVPALVAILHDRSVDGNTRGTAANSIAVLAPRQARDMLASEADDPDATVRRFVRDALQGLPSSDAR